VKRTDGSLKIAKVDKIVGNCVFVSWTQTGVLEKLLRAYPLYYMRGTVFFGIV
jgi:hypothetical protein